MFYPFSLYAGLFGSVAFCIYYRIYLRFFFVSGPTVLRFLSGLFKNKYTYSCTLVSGRFWIGWKHLDL